jgi:RNA polymerase sigma factor (sigma-70 family)
MVSKARILTYYLNVFLLACVTHLSHAWHSHMLLEPLQRGADVEPDSLGDGRLIDVRTVKDERNVLQPLFRLLVGSPMQQRSSAFALASPRHTNRVFVAAADAARHQPPSAVSTRVQKQQKGTRQVKQPPKAGTTNFTISNPEDRADLISSLQEQGIGKVAKLTDEEEASLGRQVHKLVKFEEKLKKLLVAKFEAIDTNGDSTISPEEAAKAGIQKKEFHYADKDASGGIDVKEFLEAWVNGYKRNVQRHQEGGYSYRMEAVKEWAEACGYSDMDTFSELVMQGMKAKNLLVSSHHGLMKFFARRYDGIKSTFEDEYLSEAAVGAMLATEKWNPDESGGNFASYAAYRIKGAILESIADNDDIKIPRYLQSEVSRLRKVLQHMETKGEEPTDLRLMMELGVNEKKLSQLKQVMRLRVEKMDGMSEHRIARKMKTSKDSNNNSPLNAHTQSILYGKVQEILSALSPVEAAVVRMYYALDDGKTNISLVEIQAYLEKNFKLKNREENAYNILRRALSKLQNHKAKSTAQVLLEQ